MPAAPTVIAQITDPHLRADQPQRAEQFAAAIEAVAISDVAVAAVLLTGDVADTGSPADYEPVPTALAQLDAPLVVTIPVSAPPLAGQVPEGLGT